ncbi:hypothetical protein N9D38_11440 [Rubripirellula sp.]|nr:hypothetical protein [Rubripirellula sp.]
MRYRPHREVRVDEDIDRSKIECPVLQELLNRYDSFFAGKVDEDLDIHFYFREGFFTFSHSINPIYPDMTKVSWEEFEGEDMVLMPTILRTVWICEMFRGSGVQESLIEEIKDISERTKTSFCAYAYPFQINKVRYTRSGQDALGKFLLNNYSKSRNYESDLPKQINRFKKLGFQNIEMEGYYTDPTARFIYVPSTASKDEKTTIQSRLR